MSVKPIPDGYTSVTPYLLVHGVGKLVAFLERTFGATVKHCVTLPGGTIAHAEARVAGSVVMMGEASAQWPAMPASVYVYVADVDATYRAALAAGGTPVMEPADQFYGDRHGGVQDPCGNVWWVATHIEDVPPEELDRRSKAWAAKKAAG